MINKKILVIFGLIITIIVVAVTTYSYLTSGYLSVDTTPENAAITLDGEKLKNPLKNKNIGSGKHSLVVSSPGYVEKSVEVTLKGRERKTISIELKKDLSLYLPENNDKFKIELLKNGKYEITLYAILNRPDQLESYKAQLKEYKGEALAWIKERGVDKNDIEIVWVPDEEFIPG